LQFETNIIYNLVLISFECQLVTRSTRHLYIQWWAKCQGVWLGLWLQLWLVIALLW